MEYEYLVKLRQHPAWRLLTADSAPFILGFFHLAFIKPNRRAIAAGELTDKLDDYLFHLRQIHGEDIFPRASKDYLDGWAGGQQAFLRKYYPPIGDEPEYDLTPATEKVFEWLFSLEQKQFVGTESRLLTIFRLLREIVRDTLSDPDDQIRALELKKTEIEAEIARLQKGRVRPRDDTRTRERFLQAEETARRLLSDFRQIEENFRHLDRRTRERIATSDLPKGRLLDEIFGEEDAIRGSDQGRSFRAFWTFLMSPASQEELDRLLQQVLYLPEILDMAPREWLERLRFHLLGAGEKVNDTCALLVEQLRKFLDDQAWLENRRIMAIIRAIEKTAVRVRSAAPGDRDFTRVRDVRPTVSLPMARGLFQPPRQPRVDDAPQPGEADFDTSGLYDQHYVDERVLRGHIQKALRGRSQISLEQLVALYPLEKGLSEVIAYMDIACRDAHGVVDSATTRIIAWNDVDGRPRKVHMPEVIFTDG
ncbi:MAG: DUF3375 domain-containing protein [Desulfosarcina sp.]|nr:DUF3375 domain-containing protein [Desulfobacterales bacterium]